jgi:cytochrome c-type biogenesis protein CcmF
LTVGPWLVELAGVAPVAGPNWTAIEAHLRASRGVGAETLRPQARVFTAPLTETTEAAIHTAWNGQLYAVIGKQRDDGWQLRLWWKPFVTLIWLGGMLIALGGAIALVGRLRRERHWSNEAKE